MRSMALRRIATALFASGLVLGSMARAEAPQDCTGGRPDASSCLKQLKVAQAELQTLNQLLKKKASARPVAGVSSALRRSHLAWRAYRDAQCGLEHLLDGTTDTYRSAMEASCRLVMTLERIKDVRRQMEL